MIERIRITDNSKTPVRYLSEIRRFRNGSEFEFSPDINVIVGKNGSGKTTLLKLIESYCLVDKEMCGRGMFNCNLNSLFKGLDSGLLDGAEVYSDYDKNIFRLCHYREKDNDMVNGDFDNLSLFLDQGQMSSGEKTLSQMQSLFKRMFGGKMPLNFDYEKECEDRGEYIEYIRSHRIGGEKWTVLMDEPDNNLSINNIESLYSILSFVHPQCQMIVTIHNPLLIYALSKVPEVKIIEMSKGYLGKVSSFIKKMTR